MSAHKNKNKNPYSRKVIDAYRCYHSMECDVQFDVHDDCTCAEGQNSCADFTLFARQYYVEKDEESGCTCHDPVRGRSDCPQHGEPV